MASTVKRQGKASNTARCAAMMSPRKQRRWRARPAAWDEREGWGTPWSSAKETGRPLLRRPLAWTVVTQRTALLSSARCCPSAAATPLQRSQRTNADRRGTRCGVATGGEGRACTASSICPSHPNGRRRCGLCMAQQVQIQVRPERFAPRYSGSTRFAPDLVAKLTVHQLLHHTTHERTHTHKHCSHERRILLPRARG